MNINDDRFQDLDVEFQGDDATYTITFTDNNDNAFNITNWTVWLTIKDNLSDDDVDALIQKEVTSHSDPTNGETQITLTSTDLDGLRGYKYYDIQVKDDSDEIRTVLFGEIPLSEDVTNSS